LYAGPNKGQAPPCGSHASITGLSEASSVSEVLKEGGGSPRKSLW
jgi:hypothetical protein